MCIDLTETDPQIQFCKALKTYLWQVMTISGNNHQVYSGGIQIE